MVTPDNRKGAAGIMHCMNEDAMLLELLSFNKSLTVFRDAKPLADKQDQACLLWLMTEALSVMAGEEPSLDADNAVMLGYLFDPSSKNPRVTARKSAKPDEAQKHTPDNAILQRYGIRGINPMVTCWRLNREVMTAVVGDDPENPDQRFYWLPPALDKQVEALEEKKEKEQFMTDLLVGIFFGVGGDYPVPAFTQLIEGTDTVLRKIEVALIIIPPEGVIVNGKAKLHQTISAHIRILDGNIDDLSSDDYRSLILSYRQHILNEIDLLLESDKELAFAFPGNLGFTPSRLTKGGGRLTRADMLTLEEHQNALTTFDEGVMFAIWRIIGNRNLNPENMLSFPIKEIRDMLWPNNPPPTWKQDISESITHYQTRPLQIYQKEFRQVGRNVYRDGFSLIRITAIQTTRFIFKDKDTGEMLTTRKPPGKDRKRQVQLNRRNRNLKMDVVDDAVLTHVEIRLGTDLVDWWARKFATDDNGNLMLSAKKDANGTRKPLRKGWNILANASFCDLNAAARAEKQHLAWDLFHFIIFDLRRKGLIEIEARKVFLVLFTSDMEEEHKNRSRRLGEVAGAIKWLKAKGVFKMSSSEMPLEDKKGQRRKAPYYRLSLTKQYIERSPGDGGGTTSADPAVTSSPAKTPKTPETSQAEFDLGVSSAAVPGAIVKEIRNAASLNVREWARQYGSSKSTWSKYESRLSSKPPAILPEKWQEIRILAEKFNIEIES